MKQPYEKTQIRPGLRLSILFLTLVLTFFHGLSSGYDSLSENESMMTTKEGFSVKGCVIAYDEQDFKVVGKAAEMLCGDIGEVTGELPEISRQKDIKSLNKRNSIIIGTVGKSRIINSLVEKGLLSVDSIKGGWERFILKTVKTPDCNATWLIIAGSDRRGTAYGVTTVSEKLGVSPWVWWSDVPVKKNPEITLGLDFVSQTPSVKYRGIFINDEDWGLLPWSARNFEKELGDIGPKTYGKVCELLLRLKGNMLAPAMHSCTGAFYSHPESKVVADEYGIIITTSHCEPILFNNAAKSEWDSKRDGEWDYGTNRDVIFGKFVNRLEEAAPYENIYTIGMRGVHDEAMSSKRPLQERLDLLEMVIKDQRKLLSDKFGKPAEEVPQIFVPYKETLDLYRNGLPLPDDVTIVWPDDNYGYMKSVSSPAERLRSGGSGVYYHTSYLGTPHDYLWLCTTPPALMYHELRKAYSCGADRYWLLNVGDIKPAELDISLFFDMAWDMESFNYDKVNGYQAEMLADICNGKFEDDFRKILNEYYRLAWIRKPEYMGWEIQWDSPDTQDIRPTEFSFSNYHDAWKRLEDYKSLSSAMTALVNSLPDSLQGPVFEMTGYPVLASEMMNRKFLFSQLNGELAEKGDEQGANYAARMSKEASDSITRLNGIYNSLYDGKWKGMMTVPPGYVARYQNDPVLKRFPGTGEREVTLGSDKTESGMSAGKEGCRTLNLTEFTIGEQQEKAGVRILKGIGYDGHILQLGDPIVYSEESNTGNGSAVRGKKMTASLKIDGLTGDSVTLQIFHLPFFPIYEGHGCRIGVSMDNGEENVIEYLPEEWSKQWKLNILRNSALSTVTLPLEPDQKGHTLHLRGIDPGMAVQRIVIDEGGFRPGYIGPEPQ